MNYSEIVSTKRTPQSEPILGKKMVENNAGGFVFAVDKWVMLRRFLVLGSECGTYYSSEQKLTKENAENVIECIKEDGLKVLTTLIDISIKGSAPKQDPSIFVLALCSTFGNAEVKKLSYKSIKTICRTGTQLFTFCQAVQDLRGWSRGLRKGVSSFYTDKSTEKLAYQLIKYRQRNGWTHKDVIRLSHPKANGVAQSDLLKWVVKGTEVNEPLVQAYLECQKADTKRQVQLIRDHNLPREALPTEALQNKDIWDALLEKMPMHALVRNLGVMTANGTVDSNFNENTKNIVQKLSNKEAISNSKLHPYSILLALKTYSQGKGFRGKLEWKPITKIIDALDDAFYLAFDNVEPTNKNIFIGLDVSGSMDSKLMNSNISAREAAIALSLVTARTEKNHEIFCFSTQFVEMRISIKDRLDRLCQETAALPFSGTDCALPMLAATQLKLPIDTFVVYTDSETWAGQVHPKQALDMFRQKMGRPAKLIVVGLAANKFTIADPSDAGMLDVVGFDSSIPEVMRDFIIQ